MAQTFTEQVNGWKVCGFVDLSAICGIATALNIFDNIQGEAFSLQKLSSWNWFWIGLLTLSLISLMIILVRMFRWDQKQWKEMRKWRQEYRKEQMEDRRKRRGTKQEENKKY